MVQVGPSKLDLLWKNRRIAFLFFFISEKKRFEKIFSKKKKNFVFCSSFTEISRSVEFSNKSIENKKESSKMATNFSHIGLIAVLCLVALCGAQHPIRKWQT